MKQGTLGEQYLKQSVLPYIHKQSKLLITGSNVGHDYSLFGNQISSDGLGEDPAIAWYKALNNFLCSGNVPESARLQLLLPAKIKDSEIKRCMEDFERLSAEDKIQIIGGHTEVSDTFTERRFVVTMLGAKESETLDLNECNTGQGQNGWYPNKKGICETTQIVVAGYAGIWGTNHLLACKEMELCRIFSEQFVKTASYEKHTYSIRPMAEKAMKLVRNKDEHFKLHYMHDISAGGVYGALWQLGKWMGKGFCVDNSLIPIRQETIEICESQNINPYLIDGTGGILFLCDCGNKLVKELHEEGIPANVLGEVGSESQCVVMFGDNERRVLTQEIQPK